MEISHRHLWKAKYENVLRLAKSLNISFSSCTCINCKIAVIEKVIRAL